MTTIGPSLVITGEVNSDEDMTIHGRINGRIVTTGALIVAAKGTVEAGVQGKDITVHGRMAGDVAASNRIELTPTSTVTGTITSNTLILQDGATFNGIIDMDKHAARRKFKVVSAA